MMVRSISILLGVLVVFMSSCNHEDQDEIEPVGSEFTTLRLYIEDSNGINLLSDTDGNWMYSPFSLTTGTGCLLSVDWDLFESEPLDNPLPILIDDVKPNWEINREYRVEFGMFPLYDGSNDNLTFHFEALNRDYNIRLVQSKKNVAACSYLDGVKTEGKWYEIHIKVPRNTATPQ